MIRRAVLVLVCLATSISAAQQQAPRDSMVTATTGTAVIAGVVVNDAMPAAPVRRALVTLTGDGLVPSRSTVTDDEGRFTLERLPAGRFLLTVSRAGFVTSQYGAKRPGRPGTAVTVDASGRHDGLTVRLWRGAAIAGTLRDESGQPIPNVPVFAVPARRLTGALLTLSNDGVTTDERGEFRIFGLEPGIYAVAARPAATAGAALTTMTETEVDRMLGLIKARTAGPVRPRPDDEPSPQPFNYVPIYYPGRTSVADAEPITLVAGQSVEGLDFGLQRIAAGAIAGIVMRPDGTPAEGAAVQLSLVLHTSRFPADDPVIFSTNTDASGRFRFGAVTPGDYRVLVRAAATQPVPRENPGGLVAITPGGGGAQLWALTSITMSGGNIEGLSISLEPGRAFKGRITFTGGAKPPVLTQVRAGFVPAEGISRDGRVQTQAFESPANVRPDGTFEFVSIPPGRFRFTMMGTALTNSAWVPVSAMAGDVDLLDGVVDVSTLVASTIEVTYADTAAELSGRLQTADGAPVSDVFVIAFSTDQGHWGPSARRVRAVRPGVDGRYVLPALPSGEYFLSAVTDVDQDEWHDEAFLKELVRAALKVTIAAGEKKTQDLRVM